MYASVFVFLCVTYACVNLSVWNAVGILSVVVSYICSILYNRT